MESPSSRWNRFLEACLRNRVHDGQFQSFADELRRSSPIAGGKLAEVVLRQASHNASVMDPLIPAYLERLLALDLVEAPDILGAVWRRSRDHPPKTDGQGQPVKEEQAGAKVPIELEEIVLNRLSKHLAAANRPKTVNEARTLLSIAAHWMSGMVTTHTSDSVLQEMTGGVQQVHPQSLALREALGLFLIALVENSRVAKVLQYSLPKETRRSFSQSLAVFIPFLLQTSTQLSNRLEMLQKAHGLTAGAFGDLNDESGENALTAAALQLEAVIDEPVINTRAGLYIFVDAILVARPLTDDALILSYLHNRYKGDISSTMVDIILAAFDVLFNAMHRNESRQTMYCLRSFLVNKVPLLLSGLSHSLIPPLTAELCITQALAHVDPHAFPSFSQTFDMSNGNSALSDVRQDFLTACALHNLIPEESIQRLLGEPPMCGVPLRYVKESLVTQCATNFEKVEELLVEIERMDGNAAAIIGALTEVMRNLCLTKETMSLKAICNGLSRKPQSLDIFLQFTSPSSVLQPLCQLLDSWRYEEDQGEYQPVYDEFGSILLLVLAIVNRYELSPSDIGLPADSFVLQLLERGHLSLATSELTEEQSKHLSGWIRGLYNAEEGLTDELMSSCRPQEFYVLVPTLLNQTIVACSDGVLELDTIKTGLEYLTDAFLLPCLVGGLTWMASYALEQSHHDLDIVIPIFQRLIQPASPIGDASSLHGAVLAIVSRHLEKSLRTLQRRDPSRAGIEPLLEALKPHGNYERTAYGSAAELETWTSAGSNLKSSIRASIQQMVVWSSTADINMTPPTYTHRQVLVAMKVVGARKALHAIIEEVKSQTEAGSGALALDVATALICAPSTENSPVSVDWVNATSPVPAPAPPRTQLNLRELLKVEFDEAAQLVATDAGTAEAIVRLHRRVEAQCAVAPLTDLSAAIPSMMAGMDMSVSDAAAAAAAAAAASIDQPLEQHLGLATDAASLDMGAAGAGMDLGGAGGDISGVLSSAADDDIFAGLMSDADMNDMSDMNF